MADSLIDITNINSKTGKINENYKKKIIKQK